MGSAEAAAGRIPGDLRSAVRALAEGGLSAQSYCEGWLARMRASEPGIRAWACIDEARALSIASEKDAARAAGKSPGPLHGIPVGVKDIFDTADLPTEMGSTAFAGHRPARNAEVVERILAAGGYVLGKTATTEFAYMHPASTRNPWNRSHTPGGSSSGSAAAVAAGHVPLAIGTQTNGSVIRPAAFCGVVGFKPTFDALPMSGALAFSETLDHAGVFARSVSDAAYFFACLSDPREAPADLASFSRPPTIGVLPRFPWNDAEPGAATRFRKALDVIAAAGTVLRPVALPDAFEDAHRVLRTIMFYQGARQHAPRQALHRGEMSAALNAAIDEGLAVSHEQYRSALARRAALAEIALDLFEDCDAIASLPAPGVAPARLDTTGDPSFCTLWSLIGFPALTLPTGISAEGLPFGMQLAARAFSDHGLLGVARWCESALGFDRVPG